MEIFDHVSSLIDYKTYHDVVTEILATYKLLPYHSQWHGLDVMRTGFEFYRHSRFDGGLKGNDLLTFLFALLGHDAGHPGLANFTELDRIRALRPVARSPLEEYHYDITLQILMKHGVSVNRPLMYAIIMATDPRLPVNEARLNFSEDLRGMEVIVKLADINHTVSSYEKHIYWSMKVSNEFGSDKIPAGEQIGFLGGFVVPILEQAKDVFVDKDDETAGCKEKGCIYFRKLALNFEDNFKYWKAKALLIAIGKKLQEDESIV